MFEFVRGVIAPLFLGVALLSLGSIAVVGATLVVKMMIKEIKKK